VANLLYLLAAVAVSAVLCVVLWLRNRKPQSTESGIDTFQKGLRALAPDKPMADEDRYPPG
jgi:H+/Cl- antiporter ClcA